MADPFDFDSPQRKTKRKLIQCPECPSGTMKPHAAHGLCEAHHQAERREEARRQVSDVPAARRVSRKKWKLFSDTYLAIVDLGVPRTDRDEIIAIIAPYMGVAEEAARILVAGNNPPDNLPAPDPLDEDQRVRTEKAHRLKLFATVWIGILGLGVEGADRNRILAIIEPKVGRVLNDVRPRWLTHSA